MSDLKLLLCHNWFMKKMDPFWDKKLTISKLNARLMLDSPEGSDHLLGLRHSKNLDNEIKISKFNVYCFGGSTTYGHGLSEIETWPHFIQSKRANINVINCGVVKSDIKASLQTLIQLLRLGHKPDLVLFLNGVNENSGFNAWDNVNLIEYGETDTNYQSLLNLLEAYDFNSSRLYSFSHVLAGSFGRRVYTNLKKGKILRKILNRFELTVNTHQSNNKLNKDKIIQEVAKSYLASQNLILKICEAFQIKGQCFFLEPTIFHTPNFDKKESRAEYLNEVYDYILAADTGVIDLRHVGSLLTKDHFFDWCHSDGSANEKLAGEIWKNIAW